MVNIRDEEVKITTVDELNYLFGKAYWIQSKFKQSCYWEAYKKADNDLRNLLFKLSHKAENHKLQLRNICSNLTDINPLEAMEKMELGKEDYNFDGKKSDEISDVLDRAENLAYDIYSKIYEYSDKNLIKEIWKGDDFEDYFDKIKILMEEEKDYINLLKPLLSNVKRIM
jgi:hypothetical protein